MISPFTISQQIASPSGDPHFSRGLAVASGIAAVRDVPGASSHVLLYQQQPSGLYTLGQTIANPLVNQTFGQANSFTPDGSWLFVGDDRAGAGAGGRVYCYELVAGVYVLQQTLTQGVANDNFGLWLQAPTNTSLIVAAPGGNLGAGANSGAVYYYTLVAGVWTQQQAFAGSDTAAADAFGEAIYAAPTNLVVLGPNAAAGKGTVYVFTLVAGVWTEEQKINLSGGLAIRSAIAISSSGNTIAVPGWDSVARIATANIFRQTSPNVWALVQSIADQSLPGNDNSYGSQQESIWVSDQLLFVGAPSYPAGTTPPGPGAVFVYQLNGSVFQQTQIIQNPNGTASPNLGTQAFLLGSTLFVGDDLPSFTPGAGTLNIFVSASGVLTIRFGGVKVYS